MLNNQQIKRKLFELLNNRAVGKTICPSEIAKALAEDWRPLMPDIREVVYSLHSKGEVVVQQKGIPLKAAVDPESVRGPIRIRLCQD